VLLATERFEGLAKAAMKGLEMPDAPMVVAPGNPAFLKDEEVEAYTEAVIDQMMNALQGDVGGSESAEKTA
jgi:hypothetical protein